MMACPHLRLLPDGVQNGVSLVRCQDCKQQLRYDTEGHLIPIFGRVGGALAGGKPSPGHSVKA